MVFAERKSKPQGFRSSRLLTEHDETGMSVPATQPSNN